MSNAHIPQRLDGESFDAYRTRRAESHAINKANRAIGQGGTSSRESLRAETRRSGDMGKRIRAYVALCAAWAQKRVINWKGRRDEHGAYTLVGRGELPNGVTDGRRMWLAGISAQRGY